MTKAIVFLLFAALLSWSWSSDLCKDVEKKIKEHIGTNANLKLMSVRESNDSCQVIAISRGTLVPIYVYRDYVLIGTKVVKGQSTTLEEIRRVKKAHMESFYKKLSGFKYVSYKPKNAKKGKVFYFLSDPDCPYCEGIKKKVKELAGKYGWEVRVIWVPLPIHPGAEGKAISFLCGGKTYEHYLAGEWGNKTCKEGKKAVERAKKDLLPEIGGTPFFVFPGGKTVNGANVKLLEKVMSEGD
ncbi:thioredoxin fold domain-containing protein [Hydrogenivirga sp.]